jgi:hypothetical protein
MFEGFLCVNRQDDTDPLWVEYRDLKNKDHVRIEFRKFVPGIPGKIGSLE